MRVLFFVCIDLGYVYKIVQWHDEGGNSHSALLDIFEVTSGLPIRTMAISREVRLNNLTFEATIFIGMRVGGGRNLKIQLCNCVKKVLKNCEISRTPC